MPEVDNLRKLLDAWSRSIEAEKIKGIYQDIEIETLAQLLIEKKVLTREEIDKKESNLTNKALKDVSENNFQEF